MKSILLKILSSDTDGFYTAPLVRIVQNHTAWYDEKLVDYQKNTMSGSKL